MYILDKQPKQRKCFHIRYNSWIYWGSQTTEECRIWWWLNISMHSSVSGFWCSRVWSHSKEFASLGVFAWKPKHKRAQTSFCESHWDQRLVNLEYLGFQISGLGMLNMQWIHMHKDACVCTHMCYISINSKYIQSCLLWWFQCLTTVVLYFPENVMVSFVLMTEQNSIAYR